MGGGQFSSRAIVRTPVLVTFSFFTMFVNFIGHLRPFANGGLEFKMPNILSKFLINWIVSAKPWTFFYLTSFSKSSRTSATDDQNVWAANLTLHLFPHSGDSFWFNCHVRTVTFLKFMQLFYIRPFISETLELLKNVHISKGAAG